MVQLVAHPVVVCRKSSVGVHTGVILDCWNLNQGARITHFKSPKLVTSHNNSW